MTNQSQAKRGLLFRVLTLISIGLIATTYFSPLWQVWLDAPQYPADLYPAGIRILFYPNAVKNGCPQSNSTEISQTETVDCVSEMDVINHFIGMEAISRGAQVELAIAPYAFIFVGVLLFVFLFYRGKLWWLLPLPGILAPAIFIVDFSAWLWWFGHHLKPTGAFTVKPFMPTVFGDSKVAQFGTHSFPDYGFALWAASALILIVALLLRRKQLREDRGAQS